MITLRLLAVVLSAFQIATAAGTGDAARVQLVRTPNGGIQPQTFVDAKGTVHLVYFKGDAKAGDIFYAQRPAGSREFSQPLQINTIAGSAIAVGTIRGAQLALGRNGRVHVAWNGSKNVAGSKHPGSPMWYTRLNDAGSAFEPQRDVIHTTGALDGGGSLAADAAGNVYVLWHGQPPNDTRGEEGRGLFLARSSDDGQTFARETRVDPRDTGACACCGVKAFADAAGNVFALYRSASGKVNRDETLLVSKNRGQSFEVINEHRWKLATCPMSSAALSESKAGTIAAWETAEQVYFATVDQAWQVSRPVAPPGFSKRKHPAAVANNNGDVLLAWTEGTGWQKGGSVAWQVFDASGNTTAAKGRAPGVPVWGLVSAIAEPDGTFVIYY